MYTLKSMAISARLFNDSTAPDFAQSFIENIENFGRSFELGLASRHYLKHYPLRLPGMANMGLGLFLAKRMKIVPGRIKNLDQLKKILNLSSDKQINIFDKY